MGESALKDVPGEHMKEVHTTKVLDSETGKFIPVLQADGEMEITEVVWIPAYRPEGGAPV